MANWLDKAVLYEIYPQSFYDTNSDGIGDLQGIIERLDYVASLGCNGIWLNPCFVSPFNDAGYDVSDYCSIAPRYGTNDDMKRLIEAAKARGIKIILDLVPGHTSIEHPWFKESMKGEKNEYTNRYIWTDTDEDAEDKTLPQSISSALHKAEGAERSGKYMCNFFPSQPALNFGFGKVEKTWQLPWNHPDCIKTREAIKDVMRYWLDMGVAGFRVDMAFSLVKNDTDDRTYTKEIWKDIRKMLDEEYPDTVLISEWFNPTQAIEAGFDADFYLQACPGYMSLMLMGDSSFFHPDGDGTCEPFAMEYSEHFENAKALGGMTSTPTGNHDIVRMSYGRTPEQIKMILTFVFSLPGLPIVYYGDELGMKYLDLESKEGGMYRTGSRTPMQWTTGENAGFSDAESSQLYLPIDPDENRPNVEEQENDPDSILNYTKRLIAMRKINPALGNKADFKILYAEDEKYPLVFARFCAQQQLAVCFNPADRECEVCLPLTFGDSPLIAHGDIKTEPCEGGTKLTMPPQSYWIVPYFKNKQE